MVKRLVGFVERERADEYRLMDRRGNMFVWVLFTRFWVCWGERRRHGTADAGQKMRRNGFEEVY